MWTITRTAYKLVWRQSELAFFVRWFRPAHFFYRLKRRVSLHYLNEIIFMTVTLSTEINSARQTITEVKSS